ncbi:MAG TPA: N-formylglutamate amidohydrolase [Dongiaceae bacterium]|nr:N-formylglutamate amidohydrolase [Dongiaceae bacterium]
MLRRAIHSKNEGALQSMTDKSKTRSPNDLLLATDPDAVSVLDPGSSGQFLFTCDHASNRVPAPLGDMGMTADQLSSHIAWDPGALPVALELASRFQSPLVFGSYSRLVVDLNRPPESPGSMPTSSAGIPVPGNLGISESQRALQLEMLFRPYHEAIEGLLAARLAAGQRTALVAVHSFTPDYPGEARPWHAGIAHRHDGGLGTALVAALRRHGDFPVGDNLPFQIDDDEDATIPWHGERRGLPNVLIELRQDTVATRADRALWVERLHATLQVAIAAVR